MKRKLFISGILGLGWLCMAYSNNNGIAITPFNGSEKLNKIVFRSSSNSPQKLPMTPLIPRKMS